MNEVEFLLQLLVALVAATGPIIVLVRLIAGDPTQLDDPRGIREEEPPRWNLAPAS